MLNGGATFATVRKRLGTTNPTIIPWKERFLAAGMDGLNTSHPGQQPCRQTANLRAEALNATRKKPSDGIDALELPDTGEVSRYQQGFGSPHLAGRRIKPHRLERDTTSNDPDSETKPADITGVYLHAPQHAAVAWRSIASTRCCR